MLEKGNPGENKQKTLTGKLNHKKLHPLVHPDSKKLIPKAFNVYHPQKTGSKFRLNNP